VSRLTRYAPSGRLRNALGLALGIGCAVLLVTAVWGPSSLYNGLCEDYQLALSDLEGEHSVPAPPVAYDEQVLLRMAVESPILETNVTLHSGADSDGFGPGFLLNGLTSSGYWYQVGITYQWGTGSGHSVGFGFADAIFSPSGHLLVESLKRVQVRSGDTVQLSLSISDNSVRMRAEDAATCMSVGANYSAFGATNFSCTNSTTSAGLYCGLLTEWWHSSYYQGTSGSASYTIPAFSSPGAMIEVDESVPGSSSSVPFSRDTGVNLAIASPQVGSYMNATAIVTSGTFVTG
jgi:hypothetical protein